MSRRRMDKLEDSLAPKQAVLLWLAQAHGFGSLTAYADSLIDQPEAAQPFIAIPARVQQAASVSMRRDRSGLIKEVGREAWGATVFLMRHVIGLNVHVEQTLRIERLRHAALLWWSRALDARSESTPDARSGWRRGLSTLRGALLGTEQARAAAEATYLDGHDCLFPELAAEWRELCAAADRLSDGTADPEEETARDEAEQGVQRIVHMARADGLDASGLHALADSAATMVLRPHGESAPEGTDG